MTNKAPGYLEKMINAEKRALPSLDERPLPNLLRSFCSCSPLPAYPSIPLSWRIAPALFSDKSLWTLHLRTHVAAGKWGTDYRIGRALGHLSVQGQRQFPWWSGLHEPRGAQIPDLVSMLRCQSQKIRGCVSCLRRHCQKDRIPQLTQHNMNTLVWDFKWKVSSFEIKQAVWQNFSSHGVIPPYFTVFHGIWDICILKHGQFSLSISNSRSPPRKLDQTELWESAGNDVVGF